MSGHIVYRSMSDIAPLSWEAPIVFDILTECMSLQPDIDPDAGYGVFQIPTLFMNLDMATLRQQKLVRILHYDVVAFYVLIRSRYMGGLDQAAIDAFIDDSPAPDLLSLYRDLVRLVPSFGMRGSIKRLRKVQALCTIG